MANLFEKELGIPLPQCCNHGDCCKGASPSTPYHQLLKRASEGDEFAKGFFSIMVPYLSHKEAAKVVPGVVQRTLKAAEKQEEFQSSDDIVFYHCRYQTADNKCGVWEDRPQFCRDYPDTPFVVMAPGCAFEPWAASCKDKYDAMKAEVAKLKELKEELDTLRSLQAKQGESSLSDGEQPNLNAVEPVIPFDSSLHPLQVGEDISADDLHPQLQELFTHSTEAESLSLILSLTGLYLASPLQTLYFRAG